jgi:DNA (cytosine-5)-methyltransferase 1
MIYWTRQSHSEFLRGGVSSALKNRDYKDFTDIVQEENSKKKYVLRRLTPTECARLQGFPDWWCDGVNGSDSAQYKMWGNGIALPCAYDVLSRIAEEMINFER